MNKLEQRIPQEQTSEIFALAAELQAKHEQSYFVAELVKIGAEAHILPEFIEQAAKQIQEQKRREVKREKIFEIFSSTIGGLSSNCTENHVKAVLLAVYTL